MRPCPPEPILHTYDSRVLVISHSVPCSFQGLVDARWLALRRVLCFVWARRSLHSPYRVEPTWRGPRRIGIPRAPRYPHDPRSVNEPHIVGIHSSLGSEHSAHAGFCMTNCLITNDVALIRSWPMLVLACRRRPVSYHVEEPTERPPDCSEANSLLFAQNRREALEKDVLERRCRRTYCLL